MARKKNYHPTDINKPFPQRLRLLMSEKGTTHDQLGKEVGVYRQTIGQYADGSSSPNCEVLTKISQYFNVTADYLLGLSETRRNIPIVRDVSSYLGLNDGAIDYIKYSPDSGVLNRLLPNEKASKAFRYVSRAINECSADSFSPWGAHDPDDTMKPFKATDEERQITERFLRGIDNIALPKEEAIAYYQMQAVRLFQEAVETIVEEYKAEQRPAKAAKTIMMGRVDDGKYSGKTE